MRKLMLLSLVLLSTHCFSQGLIRSTMQRLSFGLTAGANYSNYTNANFSTDALTGYHAGAIVNFRLTSNFSVQEEFLFSLQGAKMKGDLFGGNDIKVYYGSVPILLRYKTNFGLYIEAGAQTGFRLKQDIGGKETSNFAQQLDYGVAGGLGYQSPIGLGIGVRYVAGLSKVGDFSQTGINQNFHNSVAQASIFYIF